MNRRYPKTTIALMLLIPLLSGRALVGDEPESAPTAEKSGQAKTYTAYNLWYEEPDRMYCLNYPVGGKIPAGTEITSINMGRKGFKRNPVIQFTTADNKKYVIHFNKKFHPGMTAEEFKDRLFTKKSFKELTEGLTEKEIESIKKGRLATGMSRTAVLISRGYPPEHKTPSLDEDRWLYWANRFRTQVVSFDEDGRASEVPID